MPCEDGHNRWWFGLVIGELHGALHLLHKKSSAVSAQWENLAMISAMKGGLTASEAIVHEVKNIEKVDGHALRN